MKPPVLTEDDVRLIVDWAVVAFVGFVALLVTAVVVGLAVRLFVLVGGL